MIADAPPPAPPASPPALDEARLEACLLAEDAAGGLADLEAAWTAGARGEEVLVWAAALALVGDDAAAAARWAERGQDEGAAWVAAARWAVASRAVPAPVGPWERAAVAEAEAARQALARWQVTGDSLGSVRALRRHIAPPGPAPRPIALALGVRAQRTLCERRGEVLSVLSSLRRDAPGMSEFDETLAAARALAPGSRPERALGVLWAVQAVWREVRKRTSGPRDHLFDATVEAWVDALDPASRDAWVRGLHAAGILGSSAALAEITPERHDELFERMVALVEDPAEQARIPSGILEATFRARAEEHRCQFALWRCWEARGGEEEAARAQALVRAADEARAAGVQARFRVARLLLLGELDEAEEALRQLDDRGWRPQLEVELALLRGDADRARAALELLRPGLDASLEPVVDMCLRAHLAALEGRFDEARELLAPFAAAGAPRVNLPWRGGPATAELVEALARGAPPTRPFVKPAQEAPR
ncbi:MAG: hypothetical protein M9894_12095 [Planctomycetes bacterium]|nr:hypothetical protein [Planctomycetota bacterium]